MPSRGKWGKWLTICLPIETVVMALIFLAVDQLLIGPFAHRLPINQFAGTLGPFIIWRLDHVVEPWNQFFSLFWWLSIAPACYLVKLPRQISVLLRVGSGLAIGVALSFIIGVETGGVVDWLMLSLDDHRRVHLAVADLAGLVSVGLILFGAVLAAVFSDDHDH